MEVIDYKDVCNSWLNLKREELQFSSYQKYENIVKKYLLCFFEHHSFESLNEKILCCYFDDLKRKNGLSNNLIHNIKLIMKSLYQYVENQYHIQHIDFNNVIIEDIEYKDTVILSYDEEKILYDYCMRHNDSISLSILLALYAGLRIGEICALKYKDINFNDKTVNISKTIQRSDKQCYDVMSITSWAVRRKVLMPDFLFNYFKSYVKEMNNNYYVLSNCDHYYNIRRLQQELSRISHQYELKCNFNILRNTFESRCIESGMDIVTVLSLMGKTSIRITLKKDHQISYEKKHEQVKKIKHP